MAHFLVSQMNGGCYRHVSMLSPEGIALMHAEAVHNPYGLGWESVRINGRTLINHDGGTPNFQSSSGEHVGGRAYDGLRTAEDGLGHAGQA